MGCIFDFYNETQHKSSIDFPNDAYLLWRNIDRGSKSHFKNIIFKIMELNGWNPADKVIIKCDLCCLYEIDNGIITNIYNDDWKYEDDICNRTLCTFCDKKNN